MTGPSLPEPAGAVGGAAGAARAATVTVAGTGAATAVPDTALLELGVEARGSTPAEAMDACARALDQVRAALDAEGVEPARRATSGLQLHEDWESGQPGRGPVAYQAGARLTVRLARPERAGRVAGAAVAAGGDGARVHGLELVVGDPVGVAAAAREAAWRDALARAGQYAELAGLTLGPVLEVREAPPPDVRPMRPLAAEAAAAGPATDPGETTVWAGVTVTWAFRPRAGA